MHQINIKFIMNHDLPTSMLKVQNNKKIVMTKMQPQSYLEMS